METRYISKKEFSELLDKTANEIKKDFESLDPGRPWLIFGVPPGGVPSAYELLNLIPNTKLTTNVNEADIIVTNLVVNKKSYEIFTNLTKAKFYTLIDITNDEGTNKPHIIFPWEKGGVAE